MIQALYTKTEYSMLNNTIKLPDLIEKAKEYEQQYYGDGSTNSLKKENELLKVQNKVLADFIKNIGGI